MWRIEWIEVQTVSANYPTDWVLARVLYDASGRRVAYWLEA